MKIHIVPKKKLQKIAHDRCIVVRTTPGTLTQWQNEAKDGHKSLSGMLNEKIRTAFQILFNAIPKEEKT
jgi:hypothetical protein